MKHIPRRVEQVTLQFCISYPSTDIVHEGN